MGSITSLSLGLPLTSLLHSEKKRYRILTSKHNNLYLVRFTYTKMMIMDELVDYCISGLRNAYLVIDYLSSQV